MTGEQMQIGEVAERTGLSLRTIRYYEEMRLVVPTTRSAGGFRLYSESDVARLQLVRRMKPLDFSLEEMKDLLGVLDALEDPERLHPRDDLVERLRMYLEAMEARVHAVRAQLSTAEEFAGDLRRRLARQRRLARRAR